MNKFTEHVKKHKTVYISVGVGLTAGMVGGLIGYSMASRYGEIGNQVVVKQILPIKSPITNTVNQNLVRRGHPGFRILCNETGEEFASIRRASEVMGIDRSRLMDHLKGAAEHAGGFHFTNLGEM